MRPAGRPRRTAWGIGCTSGGTAATASSSTTPAAGWSRESTGPGPAEHGPGHAAGAAGDGLGAGLHPDPDGLHGCLQPLALPRLRPPAGLEPRQLPGGRPAARLRPGHAADASDRLPRDDRLRRAGVPLRVLPRPPGPSLAGGVDHPGDDPVLDQLPRPDLPLDV